MAVGKFFQVSAKGTYLWKRYPDLKATAPSSLPLAALGFKAGDWIGLKSVGTYSAGQSYPGQTDLSGCFVAGEAFKSPASGSVADPRPPIQVYPSGQWANIDEDFIVRRDEVTMVRLPNGATELRLGVPDSYFADNGKDGAFGVMVTRPNNSSTALADGKNEEQVKSQATMDGLGDDIKELLLALSRAEANAGVQWPIATNFSASPFGDALAPQWRGWYRIPNTTKGEWLPEKSRWKAARRQGPHYGWDLFAPRRAKLTVPIAPSFMQFLINVPGYGNVVAFRFTLGGKRFSAIYAHCDYYVGAAERTVALGEFVAAAGCSGNPSTELCGTDLDQGGRTDHVHLGVYSGYPVSDLKGIPLDPGLFFKMSPKDPT